MGAHLWASKWKEKQRFVLLWQQSWCFALCLCECVNSQSVKLLEAREAAVLFHHSSTARSVFSLKFGPTENICMRTHSRNVTSSKETTQREKRSEVSDSSEQREVKCRGRRR